MTRYACCFAASPQSELLRFARSDVRSVTEVSPTHKSSGVAYRGGWASAGNSVVRRSAISVAPSLNDVTRNGPDDSPLLRAQQIIEERGHHGLQFPRLVGSSIVERFA